MNGTLGRDKLWNQQIWSDIDSAVRDEVGRIRVAQKVFPCTLLPGGQQVPKDEVSISDILKIEEGQTKPFVEIWVEFSLTQSQVENEENLHAGRTLARMAANKIAETEDALLFHGESKSPTALAAKAGPAKPSLVKDENVASLKTGLLGEDPGKGPYHHLNVNDVTKNPEDLVKQVGDGIAELTKRTNPGPYALFLPPKRFADASSTPLPKTTVTAAERIIPMVTGGFLAVGSLPESAGLLVSLGGEPTTIYIGIDATTAFTQIQPNGGYRFRVFERIQFVIRDPKAFARLNFV
jgi:uncharacterized linocin/CFP29 family protein